MNTKQKMLEAMRKAQAETPVFRDRVDRTTPAMLDAALAVLAETWGPEMQNEALTAEMWSSGYDKTRHRDAFHAVINHIRNQEPKP